MKDEKVELAEPSTAPISPEPRETLTKKFTNVLLRWGIETHGITPIPPENRVDTRHYQMFFVWFSSNMNVLTFSTGTVGPAFFQLGLRDSLIILLLVDLVVCTIPAYFAVFGPKLGTRAMVQSRFSWGYYGSAIPSILNVFSLQGFLILNCIVGGQTLASVSEHLNDTLGIVIIGVASLVVAFCGYKVVHWYESLAWIPNVITFIVMLGVGGKHLTNLPNPPATPANILSFISVAVSSILTWCTMTPDYGVYHSANVSSIKIFIYTYLGFLASTLTGYMLGAAFAAAAQTVPAWQAGLNNGNDVGGLISAVLAPTGGFGKFLTAVIALSIPSAVAPTMYSFGTSFMTIAYIFSKVPRYVFAIISTAILIPVGVVGATRFYATFVDILNVIGYWSASFAAIILVEHFIFRRNDFSLYIVEDWEQPSRLPVGIAAILAFLGSFAIIIPGMSQAWYIGPIARMGTGDIGVVTGFVTAGLLYTILRTLERRIFPLHSS